MLAEVGSSASAGRNDERGRKRLLRDVSPPQAISL